MAGLYNRMVDPNFTAPGRSGAGANAGVGAPGAAAIPRAEDDNFDATQMAGLLGLIAKQQKDKEAASAAPGAAGTAPGAQAAPGMVPIGNEGNFDMAPAAAGMIPQNPAWQDATAAPTGFQLPPQGSGEAFQLGNVGAQGLGPQGAPLMSNFGSGVPAAPANPVAGMQMPASIGGAGIPQIAGMDPAQLQAISAQFPGMLGFLGGAG